MMPCARTRLTAIGSGKGGTGKTFVSVSLAQALSREGERILLFDADMGLANTAVQLDLDDGGDLEAVLLNGEIAADSVAAVWGGTRVRGGFDLLSPPAGSGAFANLDVSIAERLVETLRSNNRYDRVLLDLSAGVDALPVTFAASADDCLLVLTPDPAALTDAYAFVKLVLRSGGRMPASIVNMATNDADARRTADSLARTCQAFLGRAPDCAGRIPRDAKVIETVRRQQQLLSQFPQSPAARALVLIAEGLHRCATPALALGIGVR
jgi:flagellar biosynthesis protein FlhG